jgi:ABC-type lipoprotein release transport system permease subunit
MKNLRSVLVALLMVSVVNGFAKDKQGTEIRKGTSKVILTAEQAADKDIYRLTYQSDVAGSVSISIYNEKGELLLEDRLRNVSAFARPYNFNALPAGKYSLVVEDAKGTETKQIFHRVKAQEEASSNLNIKVAPVEGSDKYTLSVLGTQIKPLEVKIYDSFGRLVYTDRIQETKSFSKVYDVTKVKAYGLTLEVENNTGVLQTVAL